MTVPIGDRIRRWRDGEPKRLVRDGDTYTVDEEDGIELDEVDTYPEQPPEEIRGEPWGWTKGEPFPLGYREDGHYDTE